VFESESEVEELTFGVGDKIVEDLQEGLVELIEQVVDSTGGQQQIFYFLHFCSHPVFVLVEHKHVFVCEFVE
jgi:hypothetical protein